MKILDIWSYVDGDNWGEVFGAGFAIYFEDDNLRTNTLYLEVHDREAKVTISSEDKVLDEASFLALMSEFYKRGLQ